MSDRRFAIPLATIGLGLGAACTDPIVGDWELTEVDGQDVPLTETYNEFGYELTVTKEAQLRVDKSLEATMEIEFSEEGEDGYSYHHTYTYKGGVEKGPDRADYKIDLDAVEGLDFTCTLDESELDCEDDDGVDFVFSAISDK